MKKLLFILVSLIAITATAQVRSAVVASERQIVAPRTMATYNKGTFCSVRTNYLVPATGAYCTDATSRTFYQAVSNTPEDTIEWPALFFGGGALLLLYMLYSGIRKETIIKMPQPHHMVTRSYTEESQRIHHITLANGGGVLIRG